MTAALTLAEKGNHCILVSASPSERAQSNLAAGGINAAAEDPDSFVLDTYEAGENLGNRKAIRELADHADETVAWLRKQGVPFQMEEGSPALRKLGGHTKKRTYFSGSMTGKAVMAALIDQVRRYEAVHLVERKSHHRLEDLIVDEENHCLGCSIRDRYTDKCETLHGSLILASGGMSGLFPGHGTGVRENDADVTAIAFQRGVKLGNLEFIQYHPTTMAIPGKQCLISEAARSEGGRLFIYKDGVPWYFLEEKYGSAGNLLCRDRIVREFWLVRQREDVSGEIYLDMRGIPDSVWAESLPCLREQCLGYLGKDPRHEPIPIREGMHYFMGGILTDGSHRTSTAGLYAAGECACIYHGANRLGGNSLLGAVYGGKKAAQTAVCELGCKAWEPGEIIKDGSDDTGEVEKEADCVSAKIGDILYEAMAVVRTQEGLLRGCRLLKELQEQSGCSKKQKRQILLGMAIVKSALERKESRGAHMRVDYPDMQKAYQQISVVQFHDGEIRLSYREP